MMTDNKLKAAMLDAAMQYAAEGIDTPEVGFYSAWEGLQIPAGTVVRVVIELLHKPDPQVTLDLDMEAALV
jgi:hypothetical protein